MLAFITCTIPMIFAQQGSAPLHAHEASARDGLPGWTSGTVAGADPATDQEVST